MALSDDFSKEEDLSKQFNAEPNQGSSEHSTLGAVGLGAAKGATFGFDDEIAGLAGAAYKKALSEGDNADFWDIYKKIRDDVRKTHSEAEEQHPVASFGGELLGAIPTAAIGAPEAAALKGASWIQKARMLGKAGAVAGGLAGLGNSEADLTPPTTDVNSALQAAKDTAGGAASGAVIGGIVAPVATGAIGSSIKGAGKIANSFPVVKEASQAFQRSMNGVDLLGQQAATTAATGKVASDLASTLEQMRGLSGDARQLAAEAMSDTGAKVDTSAWFEKYTNEAKALLKDPKTDDNEAKQIEQFMKLMQKTVGYQEGSDAAAAESAATQKVQQQSAKKILADQTQADELESHIQDQLENVDPTTDEGKGTIGEMYGLLAKVKRLREGNDYNPVVADEPETGLQGAVNARGPFKRPTVSIIPEQTPSSISNPLLSPTEASGFNTELGQLYSKTENTNTPAQGQSLRTLISSLKNDVGQGIENAAPSGEAQQDAVQKFNQELNNYKGSTEDFKTVANTQDMLGQPAYAKGDETSVNKLTNMIQNYNKPGSNARQVLDKAIDHLSTQYPGEADKIRAVIEHVATNRDISLGLSAQSPLATNILHASAKAIALQVSRLGGLAAGSVLKQGSNIARNSSEALTNIGSKIYNASPEMLQNMADSAGQLGTNYGSVINKTLTNIIGSPIQKQKAVLFTLMQQPDFRQFVQDHIEDTGGNDLGK